MDEEDDLGVDAKTEKQLLVPNVKYDMCTNANQRPASRTVIVEREVWIRAESCCSDEPPLQLGTRQTLNLWFTTDHSARTTF